jgi:pimeloyl-ACP methyl ester carboxylesterase
MNIVVDGVNIFVATGGCAFDQKKPTVVFVHGSGLDHRSWALQARWFAFHGYSVLAPDLPGHSLSEGAPLKSIESMGKWLVKAIKNSGVETIHLVGHSQGFLVTLEAAILLEDKLKSLTAVASASSIPVNDSLVETAKKSSSEATDMLLKWGFGPGSHSGSSAVPGMQPIGIGRQIMSKNPLAEDLLACNKYKNGINCAKTLKIPSNVIVASEDKNTPYKFGLELANLLGAETTTIYGAGHMLPIEAPKSTLDAIKTFISKINS